MPLYSFSGDQAPGDIEGQRLEDVGTWSTVTVAAAVSTSTQSAPASDPAPRDPAATEPPGGATAADRAERAASPAARSAAPLTAWHPQPPRTPAAARALHRRPPASPPRSVV